MNNVMVFHLCFHFPACTLLVHAFLLAKYKKGTGSMGWSSKVKRTMKEPRVESTHTIPLLLWMNFEGFGARNGCRICGLRA